MQPLTWTPLLSIALHSSLIFALPYGCGGTVGVVNVTKGGYHGSLWTCSNIDPGYQSLYYSGQNILLAASIKANSSDCADYCSGWYSKGVNAGVLYTNSTCGCWSFGDLDTSPKAATPSRNATFIDFYETGPTYGPPAAQHWGKFTCPDGVYHNTVYQGGIPYEACFPLNIQPGQKALAECPSSLAQWEMWEIVNGSFTMKCYATFSGVKIGRNYTSPKTLVDLYDFTSHTPTASKAASTTTKRVTTIMATKGVS